MLSSDLDALAARFEGYARTGVELSPIACDAFAAVFSELAKEARSLEGQPVPLAAQAQPDGGNIVPIWKHPAAQRPLMRPLPNPIDGGAA